MKDQYFGDENDYRKYGLIRALCGEARMRVLMAWMLTPPDGGAHGDRRGYLVRQDRLGNQDEELYNWLRRTLVDRKERPRVTLLHGSGLLGECDFFSEHVPHEAESREIWGRSFLEKAEHTDLVFFDPDNGLAVPSKPWGRRPSTKHLYWPEVQSVWQRGASILIYQHFPRENRADFIRRMVNEVRQRIAGNAGGVVVAFQTSHVVFLLAGQRDHSEELRAGINEVARRWKNQVNLLDMEHADENGMLCSAVSRRTCQDRLARTARRPNCQEER